MHGAGVLLPGLSDSGFGGAQGLAQAVFFGLRALVAEERAALAAGFLQSALLLLQLGFGLV